jgi:hypothetical protein
MLGCGVPELGLIPNYQIGKCPILGWHCKRLLVRLWENRIFERIKNLRPVALSILKPFSCSKPC